MCADHQGLDRSCSASLRGLETNAPHELPFHLGALRNVLLEGLRPAPSAHIGPIGNTHSGVKPAHATERPDDAAADLGKP